MFSIYKFYQTTSETFYYSGFIGFRALIISWVLFYREPPKIQANILISFISILSALLPLNYTLNAPVIWNFKVNHLLTFTLVVVGYLFSFWGILSLGKSFGISPAQRVKVHCGPYIYLKHPIYFGYFIAESAIVIGSFSRWNLGLWAISMSLYIFRAKQEIKILNLNVPEVPDNQEATNGLSPN